MFVYFVYFCSFLFFVNDECVVPMCLFWLCFSLTCTKAPFLAIFVNRCSFALSFASEFQRRFEHYALGMRYSRQRGNFVGGWHISADNRVFRRFSEQAAQVQVSGQLFSPEHLSEWHCLSLNYRRGKRLETNNHSEADFAWRSRPAGQSQSTRSRSIGCVSLVLSGMMPIKQGHCVFRNQNVNLFSHFSIERLRTNRNMRAE